MINREEAIFASEKAKQEMLNKEVNKLLSFIDAELKKSIAKGQDYAKICVDNFSNKAIYDIQLLLTDYKYRVKIKQKYALVNGTRLPHTKYLMIGWNVSWWKWLWL